MGNKPVTIPVFLAVLLLCGMFATAILAWGQRIEPDVQQVGRILFFSCLAAFAACVAWHRWSTSSARDLEPDVLSEVFPDRIVQVGAAHMFCEMFQRGSMLRIVIALQNTRYIAGKIELEFKGQNRLVHAVPILACEVGPAAVVIGRIDVSLVSASARIPVSLEVCSRFVLNGRGKKVRVRRHPELVSRRRRTTMAILCAIGGHFTIGGGEAPRITAQIVPVNSARSVAPQPAMETWQTMIAWSPEKRTTPAEVLGIFRGAMSAK